MVPRFVIEGSQRWQSFLICLWYAIQTSPCGLGLAIPEVQIITIIVFYCILYMYIHYTDNKTSKRQTSIICGPDPKRVCAQYDKHSRLVTRRYWPKTSWSRSRHANPEAKSSWLWRARVNIAIWVPWITLYSRDKNSLQIDNTTFKHQN